MPNFDIITENMGHRFFTLSFHCSKNLKVPLNRKPNTF